MNPSRFRHSYSLLLLLLFAGCVATTTDIDHLQETMNSMQKSQADLVVKLDELDRSLGTLREKLDENQKRMTALSQKLENTQVGLGSRMELISELLSAATKQASIPLPGELYRTAYGDYQSGKLDLAISGFKSFLERYPSSDLAESAQFHIADSYLQKKNFSQARIEFDISAGNSVEYRARALLKRAYALEGLTQVSAQKDTLTALIKEFPNSPESQTALQILKELEPEKPSENPKQKEKK